MSKHGRVAEFLETLPDTGSGGFHRCYAGYFVCFNANDYYEAHDVLEHLWLGCRDENRLFYQGLIQIAGAFVHLKKHHARPGHPTDGRRLGPAARLFRLGEKNLAAFAPRRLGLDVDAVLAMCRGWRERIEGSEFRTNPWSPDAAPWLKPPG